MWSLLRSGLMVLVAGLLAAQEQGPRALRYHGTKAWRGTLVATAKPDPTPTASTLDLMAQKGVRVQLDYTAYCEVEFELTEMETEPWVWRGRVGRSRYESSYRAILQSDGTKHEGVFETTGPLDFSSDSEVRLEFHHDDTWSVRVASGRREAELRECTTSKDGKTFRRSFVGHCFGMGSTADHGFKAAGATLYATGVQTTSFEGVSNSPFTPSTRWEYAVYLEPLAWAQLHLEIEARDHATWLPTTTLDAGAGRPLVVTARLLDQDGGEPKVRVSSFEWKLLQTSREPGVALNWPPGAKDNRCDLELAADGGFFELRNENQELERAVQSGWSDTVKVVPHDWGGWSTLQVTAVTADGFRIRGKLKGAEETGLRVPKRAADSKIADVWRERTGCSADALDDDAKPVGDGNVGDGFSNYEEYRGFVMAGGHIRTSPKQKDLFVRNRVGAKLLPGVFLFADATGVRARYELRESEMPADRLMNRNRSAQSPRSSEAYQTGLFLELVEGGDASVAMTSRDTLIGGRPKDFDRIVINTDLLEPGCEAELRATVAHELSHCCGVPHHGELDGYVVWLRKQKVVDGRTEIWFEERPARNRGAGFEFPATPGPHIRIFAPNGAELTPASAGFLDQPRILYLGHHGGQHSGDVGCFMRYVAAEAYVLPQRPDCRYLSPGEPSGTGICTSAKGTRFNDPDLPEPRYGNATCGHCATHLCVRDDAPLRKQ